MFSRQTKHIIALFFLSAFILIKVSGLHVFLHNDHPNQANKCILCHLVNRDNATPVLAVDNSFHLNAVTQLFFPEVINHYTSIIREKPATCELFNRPPPIIYTLS